MFCHLLCSLTKSDSERFVKAVGQGPEDPSDLNLFHVKEVADQETALHKPRGCSTLCHLYGNVQTMLYKIRDKGLIIFLLIYS